MTMTADEFQRHQDLSMTEAELENWLRERCEKNNILRYHTYDSRKSKEGFPDDIIIIEDFPKPGENTLFVWELKRENRTKGKVTDKQARWLGAFRKVTSIRVGVMRPSDMPRMREALGAIA